MKLSNEQMKILIDKFVISDKAKSWREQRFNDHQRWKEWIDPNKIDGISDDELKEKFLEYFNEGAGRYGFNAIYRDRIVRDIKKFRKTVKFLLDESISVEERLNDVLNSDGKHRIEGMGRGLATSILVDLDIQKYGVWNNKTNMGLEALGLTPEFDRGEDLGKRYGKVMEASRSIQALRPELNFLDVDHFLHIVSAEEEGKEAVTAMIEGREIPGSIEDSMGKILQDQEGMEFAMEKHLEEFIEKNFDKISFGENLELYQDEEDSGRQYPTSIGPIDLLAVNKAKKEMVVIELKKGRSDDVVVGQISRYMGWVKENLANDYKVRGVIIVKEGSERLDYALKITPDVSLFQYTVSFDIKKVM